MYEVIIRDTGTLDAFTQDWAPDVMGNWGYFQHATFNEDGVLIIPKDDFDWWKDILNRLEALDESGIDWSEHEDEVSDTDLGQRVTDMERIATA